MITLPFQQTSDQHTVETPAHPCVSQHSSQESSYAIILGAHQQMGGQGKCGVYVHNMVLFSNKAIQSHMIFRTMG